MTTAQLAHDARYGRSVRVGACQVPEFLGDVEAALSCIEDLAVRADALGAQLLLFPECFLQGYLVTEEHLRRYALDLHSWTFTSMLQRLRSIRQTLVFGVIEQRGRRYSNTAVVVAGGELPGAYRKTHLLPGEALFHLGEDFPTFVLQRGPVPASTSALIPALLMPPLKWGLRARSCCWCRRRRALKHVRMPGRVDLEARHVCHRSCPKLRDLVEGVHRRPTGRPLRLVTKAHRRVPGTMDHMNETVSDMQAGLAPSLFLMVGLPGSGRTMRARELAAERGALQLTADDWALSIFGQEDRHQDRPDGKRWLLEGRLIALAIDALRLRLSVILDFGLWSRDERSALRWMAASMGASCEIVYLPVEREVQWSRIQYRWKHTPEQTFPMTEAELDPWREQFEVPDAAELSGSFLPSPPPGDASWFDWAQRIWPSLAQSLNGRPTER